ncbi:MAG: phosphotransferase [Phreatobacter sp.]|uniref:phosphotransferase n=1 Tax=Phreatobacter sp. TaxID=1966341 RepID=UPI0027337B86|nr:phosphotransferase [Phreatobacter sp.]MDP2801183.1 phosphotransferase [Phreatobacter sp.]
MDEVLAIAARLFGKAALAPPVSAERLSGGKNNRVFLVSDAAGAARVLKLYHVSAADSRDRLGAEWCFISYARARGIDTVPEPLAMDRGDHAALYSVRPGHKLAPGEVGHLHVEAALTFIIALNSAPRALDGIAPGSEACFSLADHLATVARRVARLADLDRTAPHGEAAAAFVANELVPAWERVRQRIAAAAGAEGDAALPQEARIVSPSDFGFHNALVADGAVSFIDFEYAGLDDPAKLVGDFFSVPEIPTPQASLERFIDGLQAGLSLGDGFGRRARLLLDAYRIKWACIILNDFLPLDEARRAFALGTDRAERCRAQLAKAQAILKDLTPFHTGDRHGLS